MSDSNFSSFRSFLAKKQTVVAGTIWITLFTFGSKLLGFVRQMITGALFGTTRPFDAVIIAQQPAGFIATIIASSFATIAIPLYLEEKSKNGDESARQFARSLLSFISIFLIIFGVALFLFPTIFVRIFAPGFPKSTLILASKYLKIFSIFPLLTGLVNMFGTFLRAERMFFQYSFATFTFNIFAIATLVLLAPTMGAGAYAMAFVIGNIFIALFSYLFGKRIWTAFPFSKPFTPQVLKAFYLASPLFISIMVGTINSIIDKAFASMLPIGTISALTYSFAIVTVVVSLVSTGIISSSFTSISESASFLDDTSIKDKARRVNELIINALSPIAAFSIAAAPWIIAIVYQRGQFTHLSTLNTSTALIGYAPMILTMPINAMLANIYIAKKHTLRLTLLSIPFILLNAAGDYLLMGAFKQAGIAAASSIVGIVWAITLTMDLKFHYKISHLFSSKIILPIILSIIYVYIFMFPLANIQNFYKLIMEIAVSTAMVLFFVRNEVGMMLKKFTGNKSQ